LKVDNGTRKLEDSIGKLEYGTMKLEDETRKLEHITWKVEDRKDMTMELEDRIWKPEDATRATVGKDQHTGGQDWVARGQDQEGGRVEELPI
jgi:hypothetical protein